MFRQPANKLSISGRGKRAAQEGVNERLLFCAARACTFHDRVIFVWSWKMVSATIRYLFYQPMDEKIKAWLLRFPAKENPYTEEALFDRPIVLQCDVKAKYRLISRKFSGMKFCHPSVPLANKRHAHFCVRSIKQSNRSISVLLLFLFCSRVFNSRSYENRSIPQMESLLAG